MAKEKEEAIKNLKNLDTFDLPTGYVCDPETGFCGPADEIMEENREEKKNENNDLV